MSFRMFECGAAAILNFEQMRTFAIDRATHHPSPITDLIYISAVEVINTYLDMYMRHEQGTATNIHSASIDEQ